METYPLQKSDGDPDGQTDRKQLWDAKSLAHHRISVAPMMEVTNIHYRFFMRLITKRTTLWTEMYHSNVIINNVHGPEWVLKYTPDEHPLVLQLGGNDTTDLAKCAKIALALGYDEINLNCGCPSPRVTKGSFGACLMKEPETIYQAIRAMNQAVDYKIPVHVKCRIGVDELDTYEFLTHFIKTVSHNGNCNLFIIHARKAHLKGLNPTQNRNIPPLMYERVYQLKKDFPNLEFIINGGFKTWEASEIALESSKGLLGVMLGRAAYDNPWIFSDVDRRFYGQENLGFTRREILTVYGEYGEGCIKE
jgi:tRNA-dihydrouridine synthase A